MRRLALTTTIVLATLSVVFALWSLREALVLFLLAIAASAAIQPAVDALTARRIPLGFALGLTWVLGVAVPAVLLGYLATSPLVDDLEGAIDGLLPLYERTRAGWVGGNGLERLLAARLPSVDPTTTLRSTKLGELLSPVVGLGVDVFTALGEMAIVVILSLFWSASRDMFERLWLSLLPAHRRLFAQDAWAAIKDGVGALVRAKVAESVITGWLLYVGFLGLGLEHASLPALLGALFRLVPLVGWLLTGLATLIVGLMTGPEVALLAVAHAAVVILAVDMLLAPRVLRTRHYSALLTTLLAVILAQAYGLLGLIAAPVIAAAIQLLGERLLFHETKPLEPRRGTAELGERLEVLTTLMAAPELSSTPELVSVVERLKALVVDAEDALAPLEDVAVDAR